MDIICKAQQSPQQVFYNFFNIIALTQLKYFIVVQLSNTLLRLYRQANDANLMRAEYVRRTNIFIQSTKKSMAKASLDLWMCDPPEHIEDETYLQLTDLVQGYIENEINLNVRKSCSESCSTYSLAKPQDCQKNNTFCSKQRMCGGMFVECMYLDSNMDVCPGDVESKRRLNYVQYEDKRVLGINMVCPVPLMKAKSWFRVIDKHCAYCMCLCVDEVTNNSNKYFSLKTVIANVSDNMIVTGLRFVKENNIIHLQVQEGKLMPYGHINQSTVRWIPVAENALYENSTSDNSTSELDFHAANSTSDNTISVQSTSDNNTNGNSTNDNSATGKSTNDNSTKDNSTSDNSTNQLDIHQENSTNELDFHTLTWESRALDLDVLKADEGHLVTGVRFKVIENHLSFDIYTTPFEFDNGNLIEPHIKSVWKDNANERQLLELPNPDISTNSPSPSIPNNGNDQYIQFSHTDVDKDLAQTIIPFIDLQEVVSTLPVPLSGAGIYYKGTNNFGGFIAPKIITYDYNKHMKDVCNVEPK